MAAMALLRSVLLSALAVGASAHGSVTFPCVPPSPAPIATSFFPRRRARPPPPPMVQLTVVF